MIFKTDSTSSDDTERLGQLLGQALKPPVVMELAGDLGAGKTTFVRGLVHGLGSSDLVSSPSFTLSKIYMAKGGFEVHHFDFYRLNEPGVVADQLAESVANSNVITLVEWSQSVKNVLPADRLAIEFKTSGLDGESREISFKYPVSKASLMEKLENNWTGGRP